MNLADTKPEMHLFQMRNGGFDCSCGWHGGDLHQPASPDPHRHGNFCDFPHGCHYIVPAPNTTPYRCELHR